MNFKSIKTGISNISDVLSIKTKHGWNYVCQVTNSGARYTKVTSAKISSYLKSSSYENDLDKIIDFLHIHKPSSKPDFTRYESNAERVFEKTKFVKKQAVLFVTAMGAKGAAIGGHFGGEGMATGAIIGMTVGIVVISVVAGSIIIKRIQEPQKLYAGLNLPPYISWSTDLIGQALKSQI